MKTFYRIFAVVCTLAILSLLNLLLSGVELQTSFLENVVYLLFPVVCLIYSIRKLKEIKTEETKPITEEYTGNLNLHFNGQISYKDYRNTSLEMYLKRRWLTLVVMLLFIVLLLLSNRMEMPAIIMWVVISLLLPFFAIHSAKKLYKQNKMFHETLTYDLNNETIQIQGDTVNTSMHWNRLFKIQETKSFFLLYHDSLVATWLDKTMFSGDEIVEFRKFVASLAILKELKKEK
jgi:Ca2+/Na+ antiporter